LLEFYPSQLVVAKEYFFTKHNPILREVADSYLDDYFEKAEDKKNKEYRNNADFYLLNKELRKYEKLKEKNIY